MAEKKYERIVKTFYDALEEGKVLGRKCTACGHIEFPPYLACNTCGNLDTEWVDLTNAKAFVNHIVTPPAAFSNPMFTKLVGTYCLAAVQVENCDEVNTCLIGCDPSRIDELRPKLPLPVKPCIVQREGYKMVYWQLAE